MAAVALACESQSTSKVECSEAARHAARFTAVVVFPTPPFWFATAIIRANDPPKSRKVTRIAPSMQLVSRGTSRARPKRLSSVPRGTDLLHCGNHLGVPRETMAGIGMGSALKIVIVSTGLVPLEAHFRRFLVIHALPLPSATHPSRGP